MRANNLLRRTSGADRGPGAVAWRRGSCWLKAIAFAALGLVVWQGDVAAQGLKPGQEIRPQGALRRGQTMITRERPEVEPLGITAGSFVIYPAVGIEGRYDDNIFRDDSNEESDFIVTVSPEVQVLSNFANHELNLRAGLDKAFFFDNEDENFFDWIVGTDGRLDVRYDTQLFAEASYQRTHEDRGSPDDVNGSEPTELSILNAEAGGLKRFNRLSLEVRGNFERFDFDDTPRAGGPEINNDDRDRNEYRASVRAGYDIMPQIEAFVRGTGIYRRYDTSVDDNGFDRDSNGFEAVVGTDFDLTGVTFGEVFVGYRRQDPEDSALNTIEGFAAGAQLFSNVTDLTTLSVFLRRTVEESTFAGASGFFSTAIGLTADHELRRNVLLQGELIGFRNDYEGIAREDDHLQASIGATYLMNRFLHFNVEYKYSLRDSSVAGLDYKVNQIIASARIQY